MTLFSVRRDTLTITDFNSVISRTVHSLTRQIFWTSNCFLDEQLASHIDHLRCVVCRNILSTTVRWRETSTASMEEASMSLMMTRGPRRIMPHFTGTRMS